MGGEQNRFDRGLARIEELSESRQDLAPLLGYYRQLLEAAVDMAEPGRAPGPGAAGEGRSEEPTESAPLLGHQDVEVDWDSFERLFDEMVEITAGHASLFEGSCDLPRRPADGAEWRLMVLRGLMGDEESLERAAGVAGGNPELFRFLAHQALLPFMTANAARVAGLVDSSSWMRGSCPVCGSEPSMGRLEEETGKRWLQCGLCATEWAFKRVGCPFCGNEDQDKLRFFCDGDDQGYRVEVCDGCRRYLKIADARKLAGDVWLPVEDLVTIHLDLVAQGEGYRRGPGGVPVG
jgi:FdhE protein